MSTHWRLFLLTIALVFLPVLTADGQSQPDLQPPGEAKANFDPLAAQQWIPLEATQTPFLIVSVVVNGKDVPSLLDTGAHTTTLDSALAKNLGMEVHPTGKMKGMGGSVEYGVTPLTSFELGAYRQRGGWVGVMDLRGINAASDHPVSALVGADFLAGIALQVDWDNRRIRVLPSGSGTLEGTAVPLRLLSLGDRLITAVSVNGQALDNAILDTGADGMSIRDSAFSKIGLDPKRLRLTTNMTSGIGGTRVSQYFRAEKVEFGGKRAERFPVQIKTSVFPDPRPFQALVGMDLLQRFNFLMDAGEGHVIVAPRTTPTPLPAISTSGVQGTYSDDGFIAVHVMHGSPAATAGLRADDRICAVDGATIDAMWQNDERQYWSIDKPGRHVTLRLCDGRVMMLTLAEFY
jgi:predicted aspartyl protease